MNDPAMHASPDAERLHAVLERLESGATWEQVEQEFGGSSEALVLAELGLVTGRVCRAQAPPATRARQQVALQRAFESWRMGEPGGRRGAGSRSALGFRRALALRVAAGLAAIVLATGSAVVASASSLPGGVLYPVKLAAEGVRVAFTGGPAARAALRLELAGERLNELRRLVDLGVMPPPELIEAMFEQLSLSEREARAAGDLDLAQLARSERERHARVLAELAERSAQAARDLIEAALDEHVGARDRSAPVRSLPTATAERIGSPDRAVPVEDPSSASSPSDERMPTASPSSPPPVSYGTTTSTPVVTASDTPSPTATEPASAPGGSGSGGSNPGPTSQPPEAPTGEPPDEPVEPPSPPINPRATERAREEPTPPPKVTPIRRPLPGPGEPPPSIGRGRGGGPGPDPGPGPGPGPEPRPGPRPGPGSEPDPGSGSGPGRP